MASTSGGIFCAVAVTFGGIFCAVAMTLAGTFWAAATTSGCVVAKAISLLYWVAYADTWAP